ncbi:MAG: radical SAM protein [Nanoarchaeota archaeon]|nr:radical SAM protein [Nanoarchaeota archaeon]
MRTDPIKRALELRKTLIYNDKVLVADFTNTLQGIDTSKVIELMPKATGEFIFRTKVNVKEIDPLASKKYKVNFFDITKKTNEEIENFIRKQDFDFPLWYKHEPNFSMINVLDYNLPLILQVAGCNFHDGSSSGGCWYCFVDDESNDGKLGKGKVSLSIDELIEGILDARNKIKSIYKKEILNIDTKVLRISGGEPTIVLDWVLNTWRKISDYDFVGQIDSNLSTSKVVDYFQEQGIYEDNILEKLAEYPIKVLTALKGVNEKNLQNNVQSNTTIEAQLESIKKFLKAGFDIYPQLYNPNPGSLETYLKKMDNLIENFSLRVHLGPLKIYAPTAKRLTLEAQRQNIDPDVFIEKKKEEWDSNYKNGCEIMDKYLRKTCGVGYKETTRSDIKLTLKNN